MDILTHTLSGMAAGTVFANFTSDSFLKKAIIVISGTVAGALPDIDVITLWSGFDDTFGKWFNLSVTGREAFGAKLWYSHHAFFHSVLAAFVLGVLFGGIIFSVKSFERNKSTIKVRLFKVVPFVLAFVCGYVIHIVEDMPTPGGGWGGVAFLWPLKNYAGGWGNIWWWNNYDIFLIVSGVVLINWGIVVWGGKIFINTGRISFYIFVLGLLLCLVQVNSRDYDFNYRNEQRTSRACETKSKEIQKKVLGENIYRLMNKLDGVIPVAF